MKICHICSYFDNILFSDLFEALQKQEIDGRVYYFKANGYPPTNADHPYVDLRYCFEDHQKYLFHWKHSKVWNDFKQYGSTQTFDLLFAHSLFSNGYIAYKWKKEKNIPYIVYVQNTDINVFFKYRLFLRKLGLTILEHADRVVFASESYRTTLFQQYVKSKRQQEQLMKKSVIIPYGINDIFFHKFSKMPKEQRSEIKILCVGMICKNKNQITLQKAIEILRKKGLDASLTLIGKHQNDHIYQSLCNCEFVRIVEYISKEELLKYYRESDVFCLPSLTETFGLVYAEAISQGLPILYTKGQGFDCQFPEGTVGYHVNATDPFDIANKIMLICNEPNKYDACISNAKKFSWERIAYDYKVLFNSVIQKQ